MKLIYLLLITLFSFGVMTAEEVQVAFSRKKVGLNESFTATFSSDTKIDGQPDFMPLKTDFEILSTSQSYKTSVINGKMSQQYQWTLALMPKHEGLIKFPPISFGKLQSKPETVEVINTPPTKDSEELYVEASISPENGVYVRTALIYTIRLYCSLSVVQGTLSEIELSDKDAIVDKMGNDVEFEHYSSKGIRYRGIERKYSVVPEHPGELVFAPIKFQGRVVTGGRNVFFDQQTEFMRAESNEIKLEIKPIPAPFNSSNWLAADDVSLSEEWSADPAKIALGEPITWTVTVAAEGALASQIPSLPIQIPSDFKAYFDKPQIENKLGSYGNRGIKQIKVALIPTKPGKLTLPELTVPWWDLEENRLKEAKLPGRTIEVFSTDVAVNDTPVEPAPIQEAQVKIDETTQPNNDNNVYLISAFSLALMLLGYLIWKRKNEKGPPNLRQIKKELYAACKANDVKGAEAHLIAWGREVFASDKLFTIAELKKALPHEIHPSINELNRALYSPEPNWEGKSLWEQIHKFKVKKDYKKGSAPEKLRQLY